MMRALQRQLCKALTANLQGNKVRPPEAGVMLWGAFQNLCRTRSYNPHGPNPIAYAEIDAWCRLQRVPLEPAHLRILVAMDEAWLGHAFSRKAAPDGVKTLPALSRQPISPALLDAMMG